MRNKLKIYAEWLVFNAVLYWLLSLLLPGILASCIALIITVGAFFHEDNWKQQAQIKQPELWVRNKA